MLDIRIDFTIENVPNKGIADKIASDIRAMLNEKHGTDILIEWEDVSPFDTDTEDNNSFAKGEPVRFQGEKYRVRETLDNGYGDIKIQDVEGKTLIVSPLTVERGW